MDSDLSLDFLSVVEQAAVETMRRCLDTVAIDGTIVIGEGERALVRF